MSEVFDRTFPVTRADLVAYALASGDPNPIHQDPEIARSVGLPDVIAHGMFTMALVARAVDDWAGRPGRIHELGTRFTKPVVVPEEGTEVRIRGSLEDERLSILVTCGEDRVLGNTTVILR